NITSIQIDAGNCFDLELSTVVGDELFVEATMDGEYSNDLVIKINEIGNTVFISAGFRPNFIAPEDKLSTHKVVAVAMRIRLPEFNSVKVSGTYCNVMVKGIFSTLEIVLDDGNCVLNGVGRNTVVNTQSGDINLFAESGKIDAETKYGQLTNKNIPEGNNNFSLYSVTGDICLIKSD
ncbi:MAG: hypothetical protein KJN76_02320, partial [Eudoraea sp.]|nr:hypothetical protein [Eudoraea sp.]